VDLSATGPPVAALRIWTGLDKAWQEASRQAWDTLRTENIAVGACASTADGEIICSARNRVNDSEGSPGEIFGSALAHAETNVLARLPFPRRRDLVLTTTLQPCLQCAGAIRLGPVATVRLRRTGSLLGRMRRLRQDLRTRGAPDPVGQDRAAPR
jgi:tRNA(Arg) A34 adenosine deaminase TadA